MRNHEPVLITDAQPSLEADQRSRKRIYATLMVVHVAGFAAAGLLVHVWWLALMILLITGPLQWVAVVLANARSVRLGGPARARCPLASSIVADDQSAGVDDGGDRAPAADGDARPPAWRPDSVGSAAAGGQFWSVAVCTSRTVEDAGTAGSPATYREHVMLTPEENQILRSIEENLLAEDPALARRWEDRARRGKPGANRTWTVWLPLSVTLLLALAAMFVALDLVPVAVACAVAAPAVATVLAMRDQHGP